jgi:hypothetical protein
MKSHGGTTRREFRMVHGRRKLPIPNPSKRSWAQWSAL